jgi:hypothetical protein
VVELVGQFGQLRTGQIKAVLFAGLASATPLDRTLRRLVEQGHLKRLTRPVGGEGGGSAEAVYQLDRAGWRLLGRSGAYWATRAVNLHTLAIADCFVMLKVAEQHGTLAVIGFVTEPDRHRSVGGVELTPDAYAEVGHYSPQVKLGYFLEADRRTEHAGVIREKCVRYYRAYQNWPQESFPYVQFVVQDKKRQREIERVIAGGPDEAQALFRVCTIDGFPQEMHRTD